MHVQSLSFLFPIISTTTAQPIFEYRISITVPSSPSVKNSLATRNANQPFSPFEKKCFAAGLFLMIALPIFCSMLGRCFERWRNRHADSMEPYGSRHWARIARRLRRKRQDNDEKQENIPKRRCRFRYCIYNKPLRNSRHNNPDIIINSPVSNMANVNGVPLGNRIDPRGSTFVPPGPGGTSAMNPSAMSVFGLPSCTVPPAGPNFITPDTASNQLLREAVRASRQASAMQGRRSTSLRSNAVSPLVLPRHRNLMSSTSVLLPPRNRRSRSQSRSSEGHRVAARVAKQKAAFIHQVRNCARDASCLLGNLRQMGAESGVRRITGRSKKKKAKSSHM